MRAFALGLALSLALAPSLAAAAPKAFITAGTQIWVIDVQTNAAPLFLEDANRDFRGVAVSPTGERVYSTGIAGEVPRLLRAFEVESGSLFETSLPSPSDFEFNGLAVNPEGSEVYVANPALDSVTIYAGEPTAFGRFIGGDAIPVPEPTAGSTALAVLAAFALVAAGCRRRIVRPERESAVPTRAAIASNEYTPADA